MKVDVSSINLPVEHMLHRLRVYLNRILEIFNIFRIVLLGSVHSLLQPVAEFGLRLFLIIYAVILPLLFAYLV